MTMKKIEHKSIKRISANASFVKLFIEQQDNDEQQSVQSYQSVTKDYWEIYSFDEIIKLSKRFLKLKLLENNNRIKMIASHIKIIRHAECVK